MYLNYGKALIHLSSSISTEVLQYAGPSQDSFSRGVRVEGAVEIICQEAVNVCTTTVDMNGKGTNGIESASTRGS